MTKKFQVVYYNGSNQETHRYTEAWDKTDFFCVQCGTEGTWRSQSEDYEAGPTMFCATCGYRHSINYESVAKRYPGNPNDQDMQRFEALSSDEL